MMTKPHSPACERNAEPILTVLKKIILPQSEQRLLEIGSGTGQHAVYFAPHFPRLQWVTSDVVTNHPGIQQWAKEAQLPNISGPIDFEIGQTDFPHGKFDYVFSANVLHIISWPKSLILFQLLGNNLNSGAQIIFYGPFNYGGRFTSASNLEFNDWLKSRDSSSGIRSFEEVRNLLEKQGFSLKNDFEMPSNNRILHFQKI